MGKRIADRENRFTSVTFICVDQEGKNPKTWPEFFCRAKESFLTPERAGI